MKYTLFILILVVYQNNFALSDYSELEDNYNYITFTMNSYRTVCTPNQNFVYSPLSLNVIYNILYQSSQGQAESDLHTILLPHSSNRYLSKFDILSSQAKSLLKIEQNPKIKLANKFYVNHDAVFDQNFKSVVQSYQADTQNVNFQYPEHARSIMNQWVENQTLGMITNLIQEGNINEDTRIIVINTVYFKDEWLKKFTDDKVYDETFYTKYDGPKRIKFLHDISYYDVAYRPNLGLFVLRVLYKNGLEFWIILPMFNYSLEQLIQNINADYFYDIKQNFVHKKCNIKFPIFTIENYLDGAKPSPSTFANDDFQIVQGRRQIIPVIIQKTKIIVNSEGTEAASATYATGVGSSGTPELIFDFNANRPFLYVVITPDSLKPIFIGHFSAPAV